MKTLLIAVTTTLLLSSCTHTFMRGTVAMKINEKTAQVCLGDDHVKVGDMLDFVTNVCTGTSVEERRGAGDRECRMDTIGTGAVTKILNKHYSEVQTDGSFKFAEGTLVQKHK